LAQVELLEALMAVIQFLIQTPALVVVRVVPHTPLFH
jgi:hypothetical protein